MKNNPSSKSSQPPANAAAPLVSRRRVLGALGVSTASAILGGIFAFTGSEKDTASDTTEAANQLDRLQSNMHQLVGSRYLKLADAPLFVGIGEAHTETDRALVGETITQLQARSGGAYRILLEGVERGVRVDGSHSQLDGIPERQRAAMDARGWDDVRAWSIVTGLYEEHAAIVKDLAGRLSRGELSLGEMTRRTHIANRALRMAKREPNAIRNRSLVDTVRTDVVRQERHVLLIAGVNHMADHSVIDSLEQLQLPSWIVLETRAARLLREQLDEAAAD